MGVGVEDGLTLATPGVELQTELTICLLLCNLAN
jgi:hypothetical protein